MAEPARPRPHPWSTRWSRTERGFWRGGAHPWAAHRYQSSHRYTAELPEQPPPPPEAATPEIETTPNSGRTRPSVRRLGDGLLPMPKVATVDPAAAVLADPEVPEHNRHCWNCQAAVGRGSSPDDPGPVSGSCPDCGSMFNFRPPLGTGELIAEQYEVRGCLAHGGLGWIYLAIDHNVSDRWVVLKGLQNPQDFEAHVVALAERQFLSEMTHPGIVKIHNFVKHRAEGYIVMEYVGGLSLKRLLDRRRPDPIPAIEAIAYLMEVLHALDYLHSFGLAYNDLKPDNIMVTEDEVKLIDLGAVAAIDSYGSIYGTPGYMAPEVTTTGPSVQSDIYTVGRTLAALVLTRHRADSTAQAHEIDLPDPQDEPLLKRYPALHRILERALDPDPAARFPTAYSMHCQLAGVLRMLLADQTQREHPHVSLEFGSYRDDFGVTTIAAPIDGILDGQPRPQSLTGAEVAAAMPLPLIDPDDASVDLLGNLLYATPEQALEALRQNSTHIESGFISAPDSYAHESRLVEIRAHLDSGDSDTARLLLFSLAAHRSDWRIDWYSGIAALHEENYPSAYHCFDRVYRALPGELPAALAVAVSAELVLQHSKTESDDHQWRQTAIQYYRTVWQTNHAVVSAAFGLARQLCAAAEPRAAVAILDEVPPNSRRHAVAQLTGGLILAARAPTTLTFADLAEVAQRAQHHHDDIRALPLRVIAAGAAWAWLRAGNQACAPDAQLFGKPVTETGMRRELEAGLRALASLTPGRWHRYRLVDLANMVRPRTWW